MTERHDAKYKDFLRFPLLMDPGATTPVMTTVGERRYGARLVDRVALIPLRAGKLSTGSMSARFNGRQIGARVLKSSNDVSIDVVDEPHSLRLALDRLLIDEGLRRELGVSAREWWASHHQPAMMADDYVHVMERARGLPIPQIELPGHLRDDGADVGRELAADLGVADRLSEIFPG